MTRGSTTTSSVSTSSTTGSSSTPTSVTSSSSTARSYSSTATVSTSISSTRSTQSSDTSTSWTNSQRSTSTGVNLTTSSTSSIGGAIIASESVLDFEAGQKSLAQRVLEDLESSGRDVSIQTEELDGTAVLAVAMQVSENTTDEPAVFSLDGVTVAVQLSSLAPQLGGAASWTVARLGEASKTVLALQAIDTEVQLADRPVSIVLLTANGSEWSGTLAEPLEISIPVNLTELREDQVGECAFWDVAADRWSTEGVQTLALPNASGGVAKCATTHLSMFGFLVRTVTMVFVCSAAATIFSLEGLENLLRGGRWAGSLPALLHWIVLFLAAVLLFQSWRYDKKHERYLAELKRAAEACSLRKKQMLRRRSSSQQLKQLLPEEMRALKLPEARRFTKHIYSTVVRQETGQTLSALEGLHTVVGVVDAHEKAHDCVLRFSQSSLIRKAQVLYMANNAWAKFTEPSPAHSCVFRCLLHFALIYSKWAVAAVFFNSTALAPDPNCEVFENLAEALIRSVVVSSFSTLLGVIPFVLLLVLNQCPKGCGRAVNLMSFGYVGLYSFTCIMVVSIFLASVTQTDAAKWLMTGLVGFCSSLLLMPVLLMLIGLLLLHLHQPDPDDLCTWRRSVGPLWPIISISFAEERLRVPHLLVSCVPEGGTAIPLESRDATSATTDFAVDSTRPLFLQPKQRLRITVLCEIEGEAVELGFAWLESKDWTKGFMGELQLSNSTAVQRELPVLSLELPAPMPSARELDRRGQEQTEIQVEDGNPSEIAKDDVSEVFCEESL
ncbi:unnamed protein product [Durusdinium trenchii]